MTTNSRAKKGIVGSVDIDLKQKRGINFVVVPNVTKRDTVVNMNNTIIKGE